MPNRRSGWEGVVGSDEVAPAPRRPRRGRHKGQPPGGSAEPEEAGRHSAPEVGEQVGDRVFAYIDPQCIVVWPHHDRDYAALTYEDCQDVVETMQTQGQHDPAVLRPASDAYAEQGYRFELISGARRLWSATHLGHALFVEVRRTMSDKAAFEYNATDNEARASVAPLHRARVASWALTNHYESKAEMARKTGIDRADLWRLETLAQVPEQLLEAYQPPHSVPLSHADKLYHFAFSVSEEVSERVFRRARELHEAQRTGKPHEPATILRYLQDAASGDGAASRKPQRLLYYTDSQGKVAMQASRKGGWLRLDVDLAASAGEDELVEQIQQLLAQQREE